MAFCSPDSVAEDAPQRAEVERLVEQLEATQSAQRRAAERALIELGEPIRQWLPEDDQSLDAELRQRLQRVRQQLRAVPDEPELPLDGGVVRLGGAETLEAALAAITRDTGVEFSPPGEADTAITPLDTPLPFWQALDYVLDQADLEIDYYGGDRQSLRLRASDPQRSPRVDAAAYAGVFRLEPTIVTSRRVLRREQLSGLSVEIELAWMPGLTPIGVTLPLDSLQATFEDGQQVPARGDQTGSIEVATGRQIPMATLQLPLQLPASQPGDISSLAGRLQAMLPGATKRFEFPLKLASVTERADDVTVTFEAVRRSGELHEVRLGVEFGSPRDAMASHRMFLMDNEVFVTSEDGRRREHLGYQLYRQSRDGIGIGYLFDVGESLHGMTLHYETPTSVVQVDVEFLIDDIRMP